MTPTPDPLDVVERAIRMASFSPFDGSMRDGLEALATIRSQREEMARKLAFFADMADWRHRQRSELQARIQELQKALQETETVLDDAMPDRYLPARHLLMVRLRRLQAIVRQALNHEGKTTLAEAARAGVFGDRPADTCSNCGQTHGLGCEAVGCPCRCRQALNPSPDQGYTGAKEKCPTCGLGVRNRMAVARCSDPSHSSPDHTGWTEEQIAFYRARFMQSPNQTEKEPM